jgi:hypothetical protein
MGVRRSDQQHSQFSKHINQQILVKAEDVLCNDFGELCHVS